MSRWTSFIGGWHSSVRNDDLQARKGQAGMSTTWSLRPTLAMPAAWADEFAKREYPVGPLVLCYDPRRLALPDGRSMADVSADLSRGAWLSRAGPPESQKFRLGGSEFELRLLRRPEERTEVMLAVVLTVDEAVSVARRADWFVTDVTFTKLWEPKGCDLEEVHAALRSRRVERQRTTGRRDGADAEGNPSHSGIRVEVDRQYGDLDALFKLLRQRREKSEGRVEGLLQPGGGALGPRSTISVRLEEGLPEDVRLRRICLTNDGRSFNTRVLRVRGEELVIERPHRWKAGSDEKVTIDVLPAFDMWQNEEALHGFIRGDVEGSWDDLARLLCSPGELQGLDRSLQLPYFYSDDDPEAPSLNGEQRRAVTGAVSSPHAFVIQGPPGTGKTSVICEVVRQLVARGERVLLLAPAHVAVDEVLSRIGSKPSVRALRITRDEDRVDEKLRVFIPHHVGSDAASLLLRRADDGRVSRWARERIHVESEWASLEQLRTVVRQCDSAMAAWRAASAAAGEAREQLKTREVAAKRELTELERALGRDDAALAAASAAARDERLHEEAERARLGSLATSLLDATADLELTAQSMLEAVEGERQAETDLRAWSTASPERSRVATAVLAMYERSVAEAHRNASAAEQELAAVHQTLAAGMQRQSGIGRLIERLGIGEVASGRRAVELATAVAQGWRAELSNRVAKERSARAACEQLVAEEERAGAGLRSALEARRAARGHLEQVLPPAIARVADLLAGMGISLPAPAGEDVANRWGRFGRKLHEYLASVLTGAAPASPLGSEPALEPLLVTLEPLRTAVIRRQSLDQELASAARRRDDRAGQLRQMQMQQSRELERLTNLDRAAQEALVRRQAEMEALVAARDKIRTDLSYPEGTNLDERHERLRRRHLVLGRLPDLDRRWSELSAEASDQQILDEIHTSVLRATNLVCATTKGIVSRGSDAVRDTDFDTLIVDEASRVTESEFLIGGVRARRWIVVGDEHQLPPYVDPRHEHFLHALAALHRAERGASPSLGQAVRDLAELWVDEGEELHAFRTEEVERIAEGFDRSGEWDRDYRDQFVEALGRLNRRIGTDPDRVLLSVMRRFFTQSMFQRMVETCRVDLREQLLEQRRMIAPLARIVSEPVYGGHYVTPGEAELAKCGVTPLVTETFSRPAVFLDTSSFKDADDTPSGHGFINEREQKLIIQACEIYDKQLQERIEVSVVTFYKAQARALQVLRRKNLSKLDFKVIDVIDAIQGQESDLVIISFTRAQTGHVGERYGHWLQDVRRLNVACTRARRALLLVGHGKTLSRLRSSPSGQAFYAHLLHLFSSQSDDFLMMRRP